MWKATIRSLMGHKLRLILTGIAVILGVGFVTGTLVLSDTLNTTFDTLFKGVNAGIDAQVRSPKSFNEQSDFGGGGPSFHQPVPAALVDEVRQIRGVADSKPQVYSDALPFQPNATIYGVTAADFDR